ncbi:MAG: TrkA C-terminal domain-containing protein [Oceanivirga sp.]|nr:TrkA C-terminal domain-containing protein [Oceanivirga sp.]
MVIAEIFVMLFRITGLTDEKARFQVISMLTNSGYTTKEAELLVNSKIRRKLSRFVMIFGYAFTVTIVSTVVNVFLQFRDTFIGGAIALIPMVLGILAVLWFIKRSKWLSSFVDKIIMKIANRFLYDENSNPIIIIEDYGNLVLAKIELKIMPKELDGIGLSDSNIKSDYGINILFRKTLKGQFLPEANIVFEQGDKIIVVGTESKIRQVFELKK